MVELTAQDVEARAAYQADDVPGGSSEELPAEVSDLTIEP
jgi:hypothetical protein